MQERVYPVLVHFYILSLLFLNEYIIFFIMMIYLHAFDKKATKYTQRHY